jgi:hypothetical protein
LPATLFAITIAIFIAVTLDSPLCHAPPSHLPPNVDCRVIAVTIALARGSDPEFSSSFFFWREAKFFEALGRTKKQTDREQHKALFLTT